MLFSSCLIFVAIVPKTLPLFCFVSLSFLRLLLSTRSDISYPQFLNVPMFRNVTLKCLTEIGKLLWCLLCLLPTHVYFFVGLLFDELDCQS